MKERSPRAYPESIVGDIEQLIENRLSRVDAILFRKRYDEGLTWKEVTEWANNSLLSDRSWTYYRWKVNRAVKILSETEDHRNARISRLRKINKEFEATKDVDVCPYCGKKIR